ncbi:MAG: thiamine pyrophosphate-binding protein [Thermodesulfobacteriota bacterium]
MLRKTGRHALLEMLIAHGLEYVFGNPGTTELPLMDGLQDYPQLKYVLALQEASAVAMADGYARATGKPSFVNVHIVGGLANSLSMLYNAFRGGTPLILTAGQSDTRMLVEEPALSGDLVQMCRQYTKWSGEVRHAKDVPIAIRRAFRTASTPPTGPVFLSLPWNVLDEEAELDLTPASTVYSQVHPDGEAVERAAHLLAKGKNPLMIVGDRIAQAGAVQEAVKVAEILGAPVADIAARSSEVNFPTGHTQYWDSINVSSPATRETLSQHDIILAVGCNLFSQFLYMPRMLTGKSKVVHLDVSAWEIEKNFPVEVGVWGDIKKGLGDLYKALGQLMPGAEREAARLRASTLAGAKARRQESLLEQTRQVWEQKPMNPMRLFREMKEVLPRDTIIVSEAVSSTNHLLRAMDFNEPGSLFSLRGGSLGWGIGGALGVKLARPNRPVVGIIGDGAAMYSIQGLWTAAYYDLPVTYVICNNHSYQILKQFLVNYYYPTLGLKDRKSEYIGMNFSKQPVDFVGVAGGLGVQGFRVEQPDELQPTLEKALNLGRPALVDVHIYPGDF